MPVYVQASEVMVIGYWKVKVGSQIFVKRLQTANPPPTPQKTNNTTQLTGFLSPQNVPY